MLLQLVRSNDFQYWKRQPLRFPGISQCASLGEADRALEAWSSLSAISCTRTSSSWALLRLRVGIGTQLLNEAMEDVARTASSSSR